MDETKRGVCGQDGCRETRYYLENGLWFCRQGHQQEGRQVIADDDDFGTQGRTIRQKKVATERLSKKYHGSQAYQLFLEVYQLVLWKQCHALIHQKGLPAELESIVKDLWTLRLQKLYERGDDTYQSDDNASLLFSSQTEQSELDGDDDGEESRYHKRKLSDSPRVIDSLALCYLGTLLLRIPISVGYVQRWIARDDVPLLKLTRLVPQDMRERLPAEYHSALDLKNPPTGDQFHRTVADLAVLYFRDFGVTFPPINSPLLQFSYIKQLALPLEVYPAVNRLKELAGFTFSFPNNRRGRFNRVFLPEVQLMSLVVIATKLFYPFDDVKRYPKSLKDPAAQVMDWDAWVDAQNEFNLRGKQSGRIGRGFEMEVTETDVLQMTSVQLDDYMDWYSKMWIDGKKSTSPFADMFPTARVDTEEVIPLSQLDDDEDSPAISNKLHKVLSKLKIKRVLTDADSSTLTEPIARPGSAYKCYRNESQLPQNAKIFYDVAAKVIGVSLETMISAVYLTEHRIQHPAGSRSRSRTKSESRSRKGDTASPVGNQGVKNEAIE